MKKIALFLIIALLTTLSYYKGFSGGFILDDYVNLINLKLFHENQTLEGVINYLLSVHSGSLKRPIPYLTFLLNASNWPADPYWFKVTNLFLHLMNGFLLYQATKHILLFVETNKKTVYKVALLSATIWLLHPFLVSTVMYVFQRMAILPLTFILSGIILYSKGRRLYESNKIKALIYLYSSVFIMTVLASFSKENGVLLPVFLLLLEFVIIKRSSIKKIPFKHEIILLYLPVLIIFTSVIYMGFHVQKGFEYRDFTLIERLLSEARVLLVYLYHLFLPSYFTEGVFTDGFIKSTGLFQPLTTFYSILFIIITLLFSFLSRKKYPLLSFSILFFFTAHILESSFMPLELYFEHRNYIPSVFLFLPFSYLIVRVANNASIYKVLPILLVLFLAFITYLRSSFWGDNLNLHLETAKQYPESVRASTVSASMLSKNGLDVAAIYILEKAMEKHENIELRANLISLKCHVNKIKEDNFVEIKNSLKNIEFTRSDIIPFNNLIDKLINNKCMAYGSDTALSLLDYVKRNKGYKKSMILAFISYDLSKLYAMKDQTSNSLVELQRFIDNSFTLYQYNIIPYSSEIIEILIDRKHYESALKAIEMLNPLLTSSLYDRDIYSHKVRISYYIKKIKLLK